VTSLGYRLLHPDDESLEQLKLRLATRTWKTVEDAILRPTLSQEHDRAEGAKCEPDENGVCVICQVKR